MRRWDVGASLGPFLFGLFPGVGAEVYQVRLPPPGTHRAGPSGTLPPKVASLGLEKEGLARVRAALRVPLPLARAFHGGRSSDSLTVRPSERQHRNLKRPSERSFRIPRSSRKCPLPVFLFRLRESLPVPHSMSPSSPADPSKSADRLARCSVLTWRTTPWRGS